MEIALIPAKLFIHETMAYYNLVIIKLARVSKITYREFKTKYLVRWH